MTENEEKGKEMEKKFYGFYTDDKALKDALRTRFHDNGIYYELSGCGDGWHFEVLVTEEQLVTENAWLDSWYERG